MDQTSLDVMAGFISFVIAAILFTAIGIMICKNKRSQTQATQDPTSIIVPTPNPKQTTITVEEIASFDPSLQISMSDIIAATKNFSADLVTSDSRLGIVYKAELPNGLKLAVKKLAPDAFQGFMEFRSELEILGKLRHRNIVRLLGYCIAGAERVLIYEFFEKGNLDVCLHDLFSDCARFPLRWQTRIKILRGVANGLAYMHALEKPIIHRDVKAENIFLDSQFEAHIVDFGLARMVKAEHTHVSTRAAGTMGYMPPEYEEGFTTATVKGDVYSFGILMLEVATGRRPNLPVSMNGETTSLLKWAKDMIAQNQAKEMLDPNIWVYGSTGLDDSKILE
ncbi:Leucine-rich repeat receptor protein kinase EXS [Morus notabilis]|uniref:Leucine-rich repeat receptor protein kinase EXS n=1 Tax=Morus notabilis TaxID=981085 RepID=W9RFM7_9ROSA|nr:probable serine/threonine-protein kinase At1g01540 [Morus notabilis]EXB70611.1 Leucine-rich repeat receptor protein kinase EXS [Morus notabilis]